MTRNICPSCSSDFWLDGYRAGIEAAAKDAERYSGAQYVATEFPRIIAKSIRALAPRSERREGEPADEVRQREMLRMMARGADTMIADALLSLRRLPDDPEPAPPAAPKLHTCGGCGRRVEGECPCHAPAAPKAPERGAFWHFACLDCGTKFSNGAGVPHHECPEREPNREAGGDET